MAFLSDETNERQVKAPVKAALSANQYVPDNLLARMKSDLHESIKEARRRLSSAPSGRTSTDVRQ